MARPRPRFAILLARPTSDSLAFTQTARVFKLRCHYACPSLHTLCHPTRHGWPLLWGAFLSCSGASLSSQSGLCTPLTKEWSTCVYISASPRGRELRQAGARSRWARDPTLGHLFCCYLPLCGEPHITSRGSQPGRGLGISPEVKVLLLVGKAPPTETHGGLAPQGGVHPHTRLWAGG